MVVGTIGCFAASATNVNALHSRGAKVNRAAHEFTPEMIRALDDGKATLLAHPDVVAQLQQLPDLKAWKMCGSKHMAKEQVVAMLDEVPK